MFLAPTAAVGLMPRVQLRVKVMKVKRKKKSLPGGREVFVGKLWNKLAALGGDIHFVSAWCIPPNIQIGEHHRKIDLGTDYRSASYVMQPGDIFVTRSAWYPFSNRAIPGAFKHAGIYIGPVKGYRDPKTGYIIKPKLMPSGCGIYQADHPRSIVHAVSDGVVCQDLLDEMTTCDYMAIFRPVYTEGTPEKACVAAMSSVGKGYDFKFDWNDGGEAFCCTELVEFVLRAGGYKGNLYRRTLKPFFFSKAFDVLLADDLSASLEMIWCSKSCRDPKLRKWTLSTNLKVQLDSLTYKD